MRIILEFLKIWYLSIMTFKLIISILKNLFNKLPKKYLIQIIQKIIPSIISLKFNPSDQPMSQSFAIGFARIPSGQFPNKRY